MNMTSFIFILPVNSISGINPTKFNCVIVIVIVIVIIVQSGSKIHQEYKSQEWPNRDPKQNTKTKYN